VVAFAWTVLALVFLDEVLAIVALGVYGWSASPRWLLVWLLPLLAMLAWFLFASPKARYGGPVVRPLVKVLVFGLASLGLWAADHHAWAVALLVFSVLVNALATIPAIQQLATEPR
jgi:hypothetical protein